MSEGVNIPINGQDNFSPVAGKVGASLNGLAGQVSNANNRMTQAGQASMKLQDSFNKGAISAKQLERGMGQVAWQYSTFGEKVQSVRSKMGGMQMQMLKVGAAGAGLAIAGKKIYDFARAGAEIEFTSKKFDRLAISAGSVGDVFLRDLRGATRGTVSDFALLKQGSDLLQLGLAKDTKEATKLSEVMTALGMDTGELTLALANQSKRRLDQLGLSLKRFNEIEKGLKGKGLGKEDAFKEAFIQTAEETIRLTGNRADSDFGSFLKLEAATKNLADEYKLKMVKHLEPTIKGVSMFMTGIRELMTGERRLDLFGGDGDWVRQGTLMDYTQYNQRQRGMTTHQGSRLGNVPTGQGQSLVSNQLELMTRYYKGGGVGVGGAVGGGIDPPDMTNYDVLFKGAMQLSQADKQRNSALSEINAKLTEERQIVAELTARYGENSAKVKEHKENIKELSQAQQEAAAAEMESANAITLSNIGALAQEEERAQLQLEFARATGQITQQAYEQQTAFNSIAQAFADGKITGDQAALAVQAVIDNLAKLDGMSVEAFINIIQSGYGMQTGAANTDLRNISQVNQVTGQVTATAQASGGAFSGFGLVGDTMAGPTAYSEMVYAPKGAYVFNASQTRRMLGGGMRPKGYAIGGEMPGDTGNIGGGYSTPYDSYTLIKTRQKTSGGGDVVTTSQLSNTIAPIISQSVVEAVAATMPGVEASIVQTVAAQVVAQQQQALNAQAQTGLLKELNENLLTLIGRTATAKDIGRSVQTAVQTGV